MSTCRRKSFRPTNGRPGQTGATAAPAAPKTRRQTDVFGLLALGLTNKEIGRRLAVSEGTAKLHVAALLKKFGVNNRTQVAIKAARLIATSPDLPLE